MKIAIDGPSGVGKSTLAKAIANEFELMYIDTGAMYRMVAFYFAKNNLDYRNEENVKKFLHDINIELSSDAKFFLNGEDVTDFLRTQQIAQISSTLAQFKSVRDKLTDLQKKIAMTKKSFVSFLSNKEIDFNSKFCYNISEADFKFYLDAKAFVRAQRRMDELGKKNFQECYEKILQRDERDLNRKISPLVRVSDAIFIDTTDMDFEQVRQKVFDIIRTGG